MELSRKLVAVACFILAMAAGGCSRRPSSKHTEQIQPEFGEPSREDLIEAVRNSVAGKSYTETVQQTKSVPRTERRAHTCTQYDVDLDINAKRNPELAKCPHAGATYWVDETVYVNETTDVPQTRICESLPGPESGWSVMPSGNDTWRVSYAGKSWDVKKESFKGVPGAVSIKRFEYTIKSNQPC